MKQMIMRAMGVLALTLTLASPLAAQGTECYDYWIKKCDAALKESNWLEKVAVGAYCTAQLLGCSISSVSIEIK